MAHATLVFPHQLFAQHPAIEQGRPIWLVEEALFFTQYHFHAHKLVLHRASMQYYHQQVLTGHRVTYMDATSVHAHIQQLIPHLQQQGITTIHIAYVADDWLQRRMQRACSACGIVVVTYPSPGFLCTTQDITNWSAGKSSYFHADFYTFQRRRLGVLLNPDGAPEGGRWSFDTENRKKLPAGVIPPPVTYTSGQPWLAEAAQYVATHFPHAPGNPQGPYLFAVTHHSAADALQQFLHQRFVHFGVYEDAIASGYNTLFHSVLTPMLNTGLLTPQQVVDAALAHAAQHAIPLNSLEGFIRQVIGWREFVRLVYLQQGRRQRTTNFWRFTRRIPASFYNGTTGIPPIDNTIGKVLQTGYCHHIERLMVLGNFMLLCEFHPHDVYKWFMEMFIDAYDWVMVPNVYGMSQFADGGLMTTKPYISGSNYIMKMSDYKAGPWQQVWDGLFWRFMHQHSTFFLSNPRLGMLVHTFNKMPQEKQQAHLAHAERFLESLGRG